MKPELEAELRRRTRKLGEETGELPRDIIADMLKRGLINSPKQAWATLEKWSRRREYNYGVSLDLGWLETPGHGLGQCGGCEVCKVGGA